MSTVIKLEDVRFTADGLINMLQKIAEAEDVTELRPCKAKRQAEHRKSRRSEKQELKVEWGVR